MQPTRQQKGEAFRDLGEEPAAAVVLRDDQVLLTQRTDNGHWSLPAGIVEPGDGVEPARVRLRGGLVEERVRPRAAVVAVWRILRSIPRTRKPRVADVKPP